MLLMHKTIYFSLDYVQSNHGIKMNASKDGQGTLAITHLLFIKQNLNSVFLIKNRLFTFKRIVFSKNYFEEYF